MRRPRPLVSAALSLLALHGHGATAGATLENTVSPANLTYCSDNRFGLEPIRETKAASRCIVESRYSLLEPPEPFTKGMAEAVCDVTSCRKVYVAIRHLNLTTDCFLVRHDIQLLRDVMTPLSASPKCANATDGSSAHDEDMVAPPPRPVPGDYAPAAPPERHSKTGLIVGLVLGGVAVGAIIAGLCVLAAKRRRQQNDVKLELDSKDDRDDNNDSPLTTDGTAPLTSPVRLPKPSAPTASRSSMPAPSAPTASQTSHPKPSAPTASMPHPSAPTASLTVMHDPLETSLSPLEAITTDDVLLARHMRADDIDDIRVIGSGGHGIVYLVRYRRTRLLASKRLVQDRITTPKLLAFIDEIKLVAALEHPCIVTFVGVAWTSENDLQALFEYMPRGDLCTHLAKTAEQTWDAKKLQIALDVIHALVYVHLFAPPLVHRDLKSRNILLNDDLRAKLSDFGVSRYQSDALTMTTGVGTSRWLAPEVINGGGEYNESCDIYSFGMVLVELDTHSLPFAGLRTATRSVMPEMMMLQLVSEGKLQPTFRPTCPKSLLAIAHKCLAYLPSLRPSAIEVAYALQTIATDEFHFDPLH